MSAEGEIYLLNRNLALKVNGDLFNSNYLDRIIFCDKIHQQLNHDRSMFNMTLKISYIMPIYIQLQ